MQRPCNILYLFTNNNVTWLGNEALGDFFRFALQTSKGFTFAKHLYKLILAHLHDHMHQLHGQA